MTRPVWIQIPTPKRLFPKETVSDQSTEKDVSRASNFQENLAVVESQGVSFEFFLLNKWLNDSQTLINQF